jgi:DNA-binding NarL/FixJ family response regulator
LEVNIPKIHGIQVTTRLKSQANPPAIIVLTGHDDVEQAIHAIRAGAMGYCSKDVEPDSLMEGIRQVIQGQYFVRGTLYDKAGVEDWVKKGIASLGPHYVADGQEHFMPLTRREMQILRSVTHGRSNQEIAYHLHISHQTVKNHMTSILRKLDVQDRTQAAVYALAHGWVRLDEADHLNDLEDEE